MEIQGEVLRFLDIVAKKAGRVPFLPFKKLVKIIFTGKTELLRNFSNAVVRGGQQRLCMLQTNKIDILPGRLSGVQQNDTADLFFT